MQNDSLCDLTPMAMWVDFFVLLPLMVIDGWLSYHSKTAALLLRVPMTSLFSAYTIYCHGRFGQTVGKRVTGIRVVQIDGGAIGWREAWLRSSVDVGFTVLSMISRFIALLTISSTYYYGVGWTQQAQNLADLEPHWLRWTGLVSQVWIWSEVVVMLFNRRRRALHDFIAGTVVVAVPQTSNVAIPPANQI